MTAMPMWRRYLRIFGPTVAADVETELAFHLDMRTQELIDKGWSPADARAEAVRCFGNRAAVTAECRGAGERREKRQRTRQLLGEVRQDVIFASRLFARSPGAAALIVLTLALGIGANAAVFSAAQAVLMRPLPYDRPEQLVMVWGRFDRLGLPQNSLSEPEYWDLSDSARTLDGLAAVGGGSGGSNITGVGAEPRRATTLAATASLLPLLGVQPILGRTFSAREDRSGSARVAMLGEGFWRGRMAADANVLGKTIQIDSLPYVVIGVVPDAFRFFGRYDLYVPLGFDRLHPAPREDHGLAVVGRLKAGTTIAQANAELGSLAARLGQQYPQSYGPDSGWGLYTVGLYEHLIGDSRQALLFMLGAAGFVLLIASANVTNLLLARASVRERELAIRRALGAGRARLLRQTLTEGMLLGTLGGALGLLIAWCAASVFRGLEVSGLSRLDEVRLDGTVLAFTVVVSLATGVVSSLLPSLRLIGGRVSPRFALRVGGRSDGAANSRMRSILVVAEIALALVLLVGSSLMMRTVWHLTSIDAGFDAHGVLTFQVALPQRLYGDRPSIVSFYQRALDRLRNAPGVQSVGTVSGLPLRAGGSSGTVFIEDTPVTNLPRGQAVSLPMLEADQRAVSPGYMEAMRMRIVRGRLFDERDQGGAPFVAIVDSSLAARVWPGLDPIGNRIAVDAVRNSNPPVMRWRTIVGVVEHVRQGSLDLVGREQLYMPIYQRLAIVSAFVVRTAGDPASLVPVIRREIAAVDKGLPAYDMKTMEEVVGESVQTRRMMAGLLATLAILALLLAVAGTYGVMAYAVDRRVHEIGVRMALGAQHTEVLRLILRRGVILTAVGEAVGLILALGVTHAMSGMIVGVSAVDPASLVGAVVVLGTAACLAIYVPARRATRIDPLAALRES